MRASSGQPFRFVIIGLLLLAPVVLAWDGLDRLVSEGLLTQIRRNNEAFVFAGLALTTASFRRPPVRWALAGWWLFLAATFFLTEVVGSRLGLAQWFITLNEAILAAAVLTLHLHHNGDRNRPAARWRFYGILAVIILLGEAPFPGWHLSEPAVWIIDHAEAWGFALLAGLYFDFVNRWPDGPAASIGARVAWYLGLVVVPLVLSALNQNGVDSVAAAGPIESALVWIQRITEGFIAALLISVSLALEGVLRRRD